MFSFQSNDRLNAKDQIFIFTAGPFDTPFEREVELLRQADVSIYSMAVGNADVNQMTTLHNLAKQPSYFWQSANFGTYPADLERFYNTICLGAPGPVVVVPPSPGRKLINE